MLFFLQANLVLFATPKTATTSLEVALSPYADMVLKGHPQLKHCNFARYKLRVEPLIQDICQTLPETVALIREPEDWLGSWYRYRQGDWLDGTVRSTRDISFADFIQAYLSDTPPEFAKVGSQYQFLTNPRDGTNVQTLFQYSAQRGWRVWLEKRLGVELSLQHLNESAQGSLVLPHDLRASLRQRLSNEYALYEQARTA